MNIFKIEYDWHEGEHGESLVSKEVSVKEFEKDLEEARKFAEDLKGKEVKEDYLGKGYVVECLPEFYEQIIWYLTNKKGYVSCYYDDCISYSIDDSYTKDISIIKNQKKTERKELK